VFKYYLDELWLKKLYEQVWIGFDWLKIGFVGGLLRTRQLSEAGCFRIGC
jgi:hypothetical protein